MSSIRSRTISVPWSNGRTFNYIFYKNGSSATSGSSDSMFFYSEGPGFLSPNATNASVTGSAGTMSLVGYRINQNNQFHTGLPVLERLGENLTWAGTPDSTPPFANPGGPVFLGWPVTAAGTLAGNWANTLGTPPYNQGASPNDTTHYQLLSDLVFRMEICFLVKGGTFALSGTTVTTGSSGYSNAPTAIPPTVARPYVTANYFNATSSLPDLAGNVYGFPPDLAGIVVTIGVLDSTSRKSIAPGGVAALAAALGDSLSGAQTTGTAAVQTNPVFTAQVWQDRIVTPGFAQSLSPAISQTALAQVRFYERTFYLNPQ